MGRFVARARREFGLSVALGAPANQLQMLVVKQLAGPLVIGVLLGVVGALTFARSLSGFLFGVSSTDPTTLTTAVVGFLVVAALTASVPARRAARVDPMLLLRVE